VRLFLERNKGYIREIVSNVTGYDKALIALIPEPISKEDMDLADNVLPLELVIEVGKKLTDEVAADKDAAKIKNMIFTLCDRADRIHFSVWLRGYPVNGYTEHKPKKKK